MRRWRCCGRWVSRSGARRRSSSAPPESGIHVRASALARGYGEKGTDREIAEESEVQRAAPEPVHALRPAAGLSAEVRNLPDLFPRNGVAGRDSGCEEGELVERHTMARVRPATPVGTAPLRGA